MRGKKAIGPVVAITLILAIVVVGVLNFDRFFNTLSTGLMGDVEVSSNSALENHIEVQNIMAQNLYVYSYDNESVPIIGLSVDKVKCDISQNLKEGLNEIDISSCFTSGDKKVLVSLTTKYGVETEAAKYDDVEMTLLDCSTLNGGEWIKVPGNSLYNTYDFCVMKYEAKWNGSGVINDSVNKYCGNGNDYNVSTGCPIDGSVGVISQSSSKPLTLVNQFEAIKLCKTLGSNYHLITNNEWMTIARLATTNPTNWADGVIGSTVASIGGLYTGNVGGTTTSVGCGLFSILDGDTLGFNCDVGGGRNKRTLNISGNLIWDFSGNALEWVSNTIDCSGGYPCVNMPYDLSPASEDVELTAINTYGSLNYNLLSPINNTWDTSYGMGMLYTYNDFSYPNNAIWNTTHTFLRGGGWATGVNAGTFALDLSTGPSYTDALRGFRCTYTP